MKQPDAKGDPLLEFYRARYPEMDPLSVLVMRALALTEAMVSWQIVRRMRRYALTPAKFNALITVQAAGDPGVPLFQIGDQLFTSRANVTALIDALEDEGLVRRGAYAFDRRITLARLTARGEALLARVLPEHFLAERDLLSGLTDEEKRALLDLLAKVRGAARPRRPTRVASE